MHDVRDGGVDREFEHPASRPLERSTGPDDATSVSTSNAALLDRCMDGDETAWGLVVARYERLVYAIALGEGLAEHDAADVSQAVFESLVQSLHRIREPDRLGHWLMTVARRTSWRRRTAQRAEQSLPDLEDRVGPSDNEWQRTVEAYDAIMGLDEPCRTVVFGLFLDPAEPSYAELADSLGMSIGSVGPLRGRCLARLRAMLTEEPVS